MEDYLQRFGAIVDTLRTHRDVLLTHFVIRPPAHKLWLRKAISLLDGNMPEALQQFYSICDGLQLRWMHRRSEAFDSDFSYHYVKDVEFNMEMPPEEGGQATGCINILPISSVFGGGSWEGLIWRHTTSNETVVEFGGNHYPRRDFLQSVQPFDQFDTYYNVAMVFAAQDGRGAPMVMGSGHHSDYTGAARLEPDAYFEFLLRTMGLVAARPRHLGAANGALETFTMTDAFAINALDLDNDNMDF